MIQRYRLRLHTRRSKTAWSSAGQTEIVPYKDNVVWVDEQRHKLGGWIKYEDYKKEVTVVTSIEEGVTKEHRVFTNNKKAEDLFCELVAEIIELPLHEVEAHLEEGFFESTASNKAVTISSCCVE